jgi:hypothetical protein
MNQEDKDFYMKIWTSREHKSEISHEFLGREPLSIYFHHILPKKDFPLFRHNPDNILLVTFDEHNIIERGVKKYEILSTKYSKLLREYANQ